MSSVLQDKKIILAVSGSIAAYKAAFLTRLLVKAGAQVQVLMTEAAASFISPLSLSTLSKRPVYSSVHAESGWNNHVELGLWADAMLIAPLTANTMAKLAVGICDNIVAAVYLSARCPVFFAPAMDVDMWHHPATQANVQKLLAYGNELLPVGTGELASGLHGEGRMAEPAFIVDRLATFFEQQQTFTSKKILITAGPTYEPIDPVRFIGNRSSGKMGVALALAAAQKGAQVDLILGPSAQQATHPNLSIHRINTAEEMHQKAIELFDGTDIAIMAAAVSDYRPATVATQKIKKKEDQLRIELVKNPDIAADLGQQKKKNQLLVGFALETTNEVQNAQEKLKRKNMDLIVLNSLNQKGAGFNYDTNKISIIDRNNKMLDFELKSKTAVAQDILQVVASLMNDLPSASSEIN